MQKLYQFTEQGRNRRHHRLWERPLSIPRAGGGKSFLASSSVRRSLMGLVVGFVMLACPATAQYQGCLNIQQIRRAECETLEKIYDDLNGRFWVSNTGWKRSNQPCNWFGVTCNNSSRWPRTVTRIRLISNNVRGVIPGEVSLLPNLREFVIHNDDSINLLGQLEGTLSPLLGDLKNLEILWLSRNLLIGGIPPEFGNMTSLRVLNLRDNLMQGDLPASLGRLANLERLDVSENNFSGPVPPEFGAMRTLTHLIVDNNQLSGRLPGEIGLLSNLNWMNLQGNRLSGPIPGALTELQNLAWFSGEGNQFFGTLSPDQSMFLEALNQCSLSSNEPSLCSSDAEICGLARSDQCSFCDSVSGIPNEECRALEALYYSTEGPDWTTKGGWLESSNACDWFGVVCSNGRVTSVTLPGNNLVGSLPSDLDELDSLEILDLSSNRISGKLPSGLGNISSLTSLDLRGNNATGVLPIEIAQRFPLGGCLLSNNSEMLCVPDTEMYTNSVRTEICELAPSAECNVSTLVPIEAASADVSGAFVDVRWKLALATEAVRFDIEVSDGTSFNRVGQLPSRSSTVDYLYRVEDLEPGAYVIRVRQVGLNGETLFSEEIPVRFLPSELVLGPAHPNPFSAATSFSVGVTQSQQVSVRVYDLLGRLQRTLISDHFEEKEVRQLRFQGAALASGVYVVRLEGALGASESLPIVHVKD